MNPAPPVPQKIFQASIKQLLLATVLGALIAIAIAQSMTPRWTGKVTVQVGQITIPDQAPRLVETVLTTVERLNLQSFRTDVLKSLGLPLPGIGHKEATLVFDSMSATPSRAGDLLNLQVSAFSREQAAKVLQASVALLNGTHLSLIQPSLERMKADLASTGARLANTEREYDQTYRALKARSTQAGTAGARDILTSNVLSTLQNQILELKKHKEQLEDALDPARSYSTRVVGNIYVPERPSTPSKLLVVAAGTLLGLFVGLAIAFFRHAQSSREP
ncbi:GNVR domain-containing protein [Cupriavidus sp. BIS7]|uniref:GNVR domain-containing protein n=1 Tax=Cupriavidus sp. BIS7 TaxID=1217718 RepID=UPI000364E785|nr:GNVR domain-containing protein [Cupriavidus sp. BIS7]